MKTTTLIMGALALAAAGVAPAMARQTRAQIATAKKCQAMSHKAMTRNKSCMAMKRDLKKIDIAHPRALSSDKGTSADTLDKGKSSTDGSMASDSKSSGATSPANAKPIR